MRLLTFARPEALNAFTQEMYSAVGTALQESAEAPGVAVVVMTGEGRAFCAGQDLEELAKVGRSSRRGQELPHGFPAFMDTLSTFPKPVIAAVNGVGVGLGVTLLAHCDLVLIAEGARLRAPFTSLGLVPEAASSLLLPQIMGWQQAARFLFTSEWISAEEAVSAGLAWRVFPRDTLVEKAMELATAIAAMPISSLVGTKGLMLASRSDAVKRARGREDLEFGRLTGGPANREAVAAFLEKRPADFTKLGD